MKTAILEEKLLEIEAKRPFHNDEDMVKAIESILKKEYRKRESKQNSILIVVFLRVSLVFTRGIQAVTVSAKQVVRLKKNKAGVQERIYKPKANAPIGVIQSEHLL